MQQLPSQLLEASKQLLSQGTWGDGSCTHTDATPAWWQVDLGGLAHVDHVSVYHRTDCCQDRLQGAHVIVSRTSDFSTGRMCDALSDYTSTPVRQTRHLLPHRAAHLISD